MLDKKNHIFSRRALLLIGMKLSLFFVLIVRLFYLQILQSDRFKADSDKNRMRLILLPPARGTISDRSGVVIASNKHYYQVLFNLQSKEKNQEIIAKLSDILALSDYEKTRIKTKIARHRSPNPLAIMKHLPWSDVAKIEANTPDLPGIVINVGQKRYYPFAEKSAHVLGYLGPLPAEELKRNPLLSHPDMRTGKGGIEKGYEDLLRGTAGIKHVEANAYGRYLREIERQESQEGKALSLTLDQTLQSFCQEQLIGKVGSIVILDAKQGGVISLASSPNFDPNSLSYELAPDEWAELINNPDKPLLNRAVSTAYPPGSTFKMVVALAALEAGINPLQRHHCSGGVSIGRTYFHCWKRGGHGKVNLTSAMMQSCNSYFYLTAKKIGADKIADMARRLGLGQNYDIAIANQAAGNVPDTPWKKQVLDEKWHLGDTLNTAIGQGYVLASPLQLATMTARLASGKLLSPHFISSGVIAETADINPEHLALVRKAMMHVVNTPGGTAYRSRLAEKNAVLSGKTGTVQVISKSARKRLEKKYSAEQRKKLENHALFVGFTTPANSSTPEYAISIVIEHGGGGSKAAAPIAKAIFDFHYNSGGS